MPFCPQCGAENPPSARFCDQCGAVLVAVPVQGRPLVPATSMVPTPAPRPVAAPAPASVSVCPQCGTAVIPGEAFCDNCGAALLGSARPTPAVVAPTPPYSGVPVQPTYPPPQPSYAPPQPAPPQPVAPPQPPAPPLPPQPVAPPARTTLAPASLNVRASNTTLPLPAATQAIVGRADPVSNFFPDLDLTPHGAIAGGVGRRHARLFVQAGQLLLEDLDSTNGTFHNRVRLTPRQPVALADGDEVRFGTLLLAVKL